MLKLIDANDKICPLLKGPELNYNFFRLVRFEMKLNKSSNGTDADANNSSRLSHMNLGGIK